MKITMAAISTLAVASAIVRVLESGSEVEGSTGSLAEII